LTKSSRTNIPYSLSGPAAREKLPNSGLELELELVLLSYWLFVSFYGDGNYGKNFKEASMVDHSIKLPLTPRILS
jgi:hypothetical protein